MERRDASGSPRTYADGERAQGGAQSRSTDEVSEQGRGNRRRRGWREGDWLKGTCPSKTRPGFKAGKVRSVRWSGYVRLRLGIGRCGSPRSCTTSYDLETLRAAYFSLKREAAAGVDGETWRHYGEQLEEN